MKIYLDMKDFCPLRCPRPVLTIGNFDGLHRGHQALVTQLCNLAREIGGTPVAMTFSPHPKAILTGRHPHRISTIRDKVVGLEQLGVSVLIIQLFDWQLAATEPETFVAELLESVQPAAVLLGYDFRFGAKGRGTVDMFRSLAEPHGVEVHQAPVCEVDGRVVSSSLIRELLASGDLVEAERFLGHPYRLRGEVRHGAGRGKTLNIPTANIEPVQDLFLPTGIYAGALDSVDDHPVSRPAAISLGYNPTFETNRPAPSFEVHIVDFDEDLYGREIGISIFQRLRGEIRFENVDALVAQIHDDIARSVTIYKERVQ